MILALVLAGRSPARSQTPAHRRLAAAAVVLLALGSALLQAGPAAEEPKAPDADAKSVLARIDDMRRDVERIMGLQALRPIPHDVLSREQINALVTERIDEDGNAEDLRQEELFLEVFGFVRPGFDLGAEVVNTLTEQATALYDYKSKKLYLSTWTPDDMLEFALVHELAHAIADQHFNLGKYVGKSKSADGDLARSAVIEGQASWVMTEWVMQQSGRSLLTNNSLAAAAAGASRFEVASYPVFSSQPLYMQASMLFPYTDGLLFMQAALREFGQEGMSRPFELAPLSTQHILAPETYFEGREPVKPDLPKWRSKGFERTSRGDIGQHDHLVLIRQYVGDRAAERIAPRWRGGRYEILQNESRSRAVLRYASEWADPAAAKRFFGLYRRVLEGKSDRFALTVDSASRLEGEGDRGRFVVELDGSRVRSLEGLPAETTRTD